MSKSLINNTRGVQEKLSDGSVGFKSNDVKSILRGLVWRSFSIARPNDTTEVYTFYEDNNYVTALATITLEYTDNTKANLLRGFRTDL